MNKKLPWKDLKRILLEDYQLEDLRLGSNKADNTDFSNYHTNWNGTKKELQEYIKTVRTKDVVEVFIYHKSDSRYFFTIWNDLEGYLF